MKIPSYVNNVTDFIFKKCSKDLGSVLIWTTIAGWAASSGAQIMGIVRNSKYTKEQKRFMINQELGDAAVNILSYFALTMPVKKVATKMVSTGKVLPRSLKMNIIRHGDGRRLGKLDFDVSSTGYLTEKEVKSYESFKNFVSTAAAVVGGVLSSNIITPILRNKFASKKQVKFLSQSEPSTPEKISVKPPVQSPAKPNYKPSPFDQFKTAGMSI